MPRTLTNQTVKNTNPILLNINLSNFNTQAFLNFIEEILRSDIIQKKPLQIQLIFTQFTFTGSFEEIKGDLSNHTDEEPILFLVEKVTTSSGWNISIEFNFPNDQCSIKYLSSNNSAIKTRPIRNTNISPSFIEEAIPIKMLINKYTQPYIPKYEDALNKLEKDLNYIDFLTKKKTNLKDNLESLERLIEEAKVKLDSAEEYKTAANRGKQDISNYLKNSSDIVNQTQNAKQESELYKNEIADILNNSKKYYKEISTHTEQAERDFLRLKVIKDELSKAFEETKIELEESQKDYRLNLENNVSENKKRIEYYDTENKRLIERIENTLQIATGGALGNEFEKERKTVQKGLIGFLIGVVAVAVIIVGVLMFVTYYMKHPMTNSDYHFLALRFLLISPLLFLEWFLINEYIGKRRLAQHYAFKSVISLSLPAYNKLIEQHKDQTQTLNLIENAIDKIYSLPRDGSELSEKNIKKVLALLKSITDTLRKTNNPLSDEINPIEIVRKCTTETKESKAFSSNKEETKKS